ncbi:MULTISPECIES: hypothetical protein [Moorena]|uniref:Uncharacterized protein n=1 Tax=Moorena producens 3L TaxID=489825 RepID=F4XZM0_9CYAN|nr:MULTISPECIES: hypothetical protein [Moorena]NEQ15938.1 hypothetical protein [Moorena sp. SIO3E2]NES86868.1 hypothetical protein [Moorena sp. SIO2B7]EGJ30025.1 hypothetical protein LYNGBM3L_58360 [Moorena producens 3L]NEP35954.1 hypothetical protein [Moorena sp. SIO3B2]NEP64407.1 hypothetical protein [Moorena sp. SIO3A5]
MRYAQPKAIGLRPRYANAGIQLGSSELEHCYQQCDWPTATLRERTSTKNQHSNSNAIAPEPISQFKRDWPTATLRDRTLWQKPIIPIQAHR